MTKTMNKAKYLLAFLAAAILAVALSSVAWAANDGSITVTNATAGQTYQAFKVFDATPSNPDKVSDGIVYTATPAQVAVEGFDAIFDKVRDQNGNYTVSKKSTVSDNDVITFVKGHINALKQGEAIDGVFGDNDTVTFSNLPYGYYYISSSLGSVVTIDTAGKQIQVVDKNESTPTGPDKDITAEDSSVNAGQDQTGVELKTNAAAVGSVESFQVDFNATNWVQSDEAQTAGSGNGTKTKVTQYNFVDTPTGLAIDASTVRVYVNYGTDAQAEVTSTITDIAVNETSGVLTFTIPWVNAAGNHLYATQTAGSELIPVHVTYDATITAAAATATAPNTVEVLYNNSPDNSLGTSTTTTKTYKFKLNKLDENRQALAGAEFQLFYANGEGAATGDALKFTVVDGKYQFDPAGNVTNIAPAGADASALIIGLDDARYVLQEVVVPSGYNKAEDTAVTGLSPVDTADAQATAIDVQNLKGSVLPSTGGMGTTILYIVGGIMVLVAVVFLITKRRVKSGRGGDDLM